jgi:hypothetical protein
MKTHTQPCLLPLQNLKHRDPLQSLLTLDLNKVKSNHPFYRLPPFDWHFYQKDQPLTLCPFTAGVLNSLHVCTRWGLELMSSVLREQIISFTAKKLPPIFESWAAISPEAHILTTSFKRSKPLTPSAITKLRMITNKLQTDLFRILSAPKTAKLIHLPHLLLDFNNLKQWMKIAGIRRLYQLRMLLDGLLPFGDRQLKNLDIDTTSAGYVTEWVISRHNVSNTTACTVKPLPLATSPSIAPEILIEELIAGTCPQVPWRFSQQRRTTSPPTLPFLMEPTPPLYYSPTSPVYQPLLTPPPSCQSIMSTPTPLTPLPLQGLPQLPVQSINPSLLFANQVQDPRPRMLANSANIPILPPIHTLEEALLLTAHLINNLPEGPHLQNLSRATMNLITMMLPSTT